MTADFYRTLRSVYIDPLIQSSQCAYDLGTVMNHPHFTDIEMRGLRLRSHNQQMAELRFEPRSESIEFTAPLFHSHTVPTHVVTDLL